MYMIFNRDGEFHNLMIECRRSNDGRPHIDDTTHLKIRDVVTEVEGSIYAFDIHKITHAEENGCQKMTVKYSFCRGGNYRQRPLIAVDTFIELKEIG